MLRWLMNLFGIKPRLDIESRRCTLCGRPFPAMTDSPRTICPRC